MFDPTQTFWGQQMKHYYVQETEIMKENVVAFPSNHLEINGVSFTSEEILHCLRENEDGDARLFKKIHNGKLVFDHAENAWYKYQDPHWEIDALEEVVASVQQVINVYKFEARRQHALAKIAMKEGETTQEKEHNNNLKFLQKRIKSLQTAYRKKKVDYLSRVGTGLKGDEWDNDPWLLGCKDGVVDLRTGILRAGRPEDYIRRVTSTSWKGIDAPCLEFMRMLEGIFAGDKEIIEFIQRLMGYSLLGSNPLHLFIILYGAMGRNGKNTFIETIQAVLGQYASKAKVELLLKQRFAQHSGAADADKMALRGCRLVYISETNDGDMISNDKIKSLSGDKTIRTRAPYSKHSIEFATTFKIFLLTNFKPKVHTGLDNGLWERIILVPFNLSFVHHDPVFPHERRADKDLPEKLLLEAPGILAWMVKGFLDYQANGLRIPEVVRDATKEYRHEISILDRFLDSEWCVIGENHSVQADKFYRAYERFCSQSGIPPISQTKFGKEMKKKFQCEKGATVKYLGVDVIEGIEG